MRENLIQNDLLEEKVREALEGYWKDSDLPNLCISSMEGFRIVLLVELEKLETHHLPGSGVFVRLTEVQALIESLR